MLALATDRHIRQYQLKIQAKSQKKLISLSDRLSNNIGECSRMLYQINLDLGAVGI